MSVLKITEVAEALRVSPMTVRRLIECGELKAYKVGGSWRIDSDHVANYLKAIETESANNNATA